MEKIFTSRTSAKEILPRTLVEIDDYKKKLPQKEAFLISTKMDF